MSFFDILPPAFPVRDIVTAFSLFANFMAFRTFTEFPLPLIPITISFFSNRFSNCFLKIFSYEVSLAHAKMTGILSDKENALIFFVFLG